MKHTPQLDRYNKIVLLESQLVQQKEIIRLMEQQIEITKKLLNLLEETA